ncbi:MAG: CBS domain-containing protein [Anaerolineales bacterium]|nr:CBS domain-containing protein [Anaerolineales bacterium]
MPTAPAPVTVEKWMTTDVMTVQPDMPLDAVYRIMAIQDIRHMPVVKEGRAVGAGHERGCDAGANAGASGTPRPESAPIPGRDRRHDIPHYHSGHGLGRFGHSSALAPQSVGAGRGE